MSMNYDEREISFDIVEHIGVLSTFGTGWTKELNLVSWNGGIPKYDIRDWDPTHTHMSRGITLQEDEMRAVLRSMKSRRNHRLRSASETKSEAADDDKELASEFTEFKDEKSDSGTEDEKL